MKKSKKFTAIFILTSMSLIAAPTLTVSCSNHKKEIWNTFADFKKAAQSETITNIITTTQSQTKWEQNDIFSTPIFSEKNNTSISLYLENRTKFENATFTATYMQNKKYQLSDWKVATIAGNVVWQQFKEAIQQENPSTLINLLSQKELDNWHWTKDDLPIFWHPKQEFVINEQTKSITTDLVIAGAAANICYPLNFTIKFTGRYYDSKNWIATPISDTYWANFKNKIKEITPSQFLTLAVKQNAAANWKIDQDTPVWDTFGNEPDNPADKYPGMGGQLTFNDTTHSATAIISISGTSDYNAYPIEIEINQKTNEEFNINNCVCKRIEQFQSILLFQKRCFDLVGANTGLMKQTPILSAWFSKHNVNLSTLTIINNTQDQIPDQYGISARHNIMFSYYVNGDVHDTFQNTAFNVSHIPANNSSICLAYTINNWWINA